MSESKEPAVGELTESTAETYEAFFVPALFDQWTGRVLDAVEITPGDDVLDVGCGTGVLARAAARRLDGAGSVTGVDLNEGMLTVARRASEHVTWHLGPAERIAFPDHSFDRIVSQFALMFFTDKRAALAEMARLARPGSRIAIATWADIEQSPGYYAMVELLQRLFGNDAAIALKAPFALGTEDKMTALVGGVLANTTVTRNEGEARFDSVEAWVHTDIRGWTLSDMIDDDQYAELLAAASTELARFVGHDGQVRFPAPALITTAAVPPGAGK